MNKLFESVDNLFSSDSNLTLNAEKERKDRVAKLRESVKARSLKPEALKESKDGKSLKEHDFDMDSDPVEILKAIHEQYMNLGMNDEFYNDVLNRSDLGIEDLISWFEMGESDKNCKSEKDCKSEKKEVLKESSEMCVAMECSRTGYGPDQVVGDSLTVNELIDVLNGFDGDMKIVTSHDNGYTYGPISYGDFEEINVSDDEESEDEDYNESEKVSHRVKENEETKLFNKVARICESRKATNNVVKESNANILKRAGKKPVNKKSL